ncbi:MAG: cyclic GMP-AMP synthase DncV-like nucleotidyltransferase [Thermomicrobiales bacterium]
MANIQRQFEQFHETIKLKRFGENEILREKRDIIRKKLKDRLPDVFAAHGEACPTFRFRDQGSYEMDTGVKPLNDDYDIDQGLYFAVGTDAYPDPVVLKRRVREALTGHTKDVRIRRSCVTIFYQREGEPIYHVDVAVYADGSHEADGKARLAKGRESSETEHRIWEISNPQALTEKIEGRFAGNDRAQFRRVVRSLKRWSDKSFPKDGNAAPLGIGLTVAAYYDLQCAYTDVIAGKPDDLRALRDLVRAILGRFVITGFDWSTLRPIRRLSVKLPVEPYTDLFARMSDKQMVEFEDKLKRLRDALDAASSVVDPVEACQELQKVFGKDFPVPAPEDTARRHAPAIVSSSSSA